MSNQTTAQEGHGIVRPATSTDIVYKAYKRPYAGGPFQVLNLFASCSYPTGQWKIFFAGDGANRYKLLEQVPSIVNQLMTYYVADFTTGVGLATDPTTVVIVDAHGEHVVPVEPMP